LRAIKESGAGMNSIKVLGIRLAISNKDLLVDELVNSLSESALKSGRSYCFVNVNTLVEANEDKHYFDLLKDNPHNFCDGAPVHWIVRKKTSKRDVPSERTPGPDIFARVVPAVEGAVPQYFIGSSDDVLLKLKDKLGLYSRFSHFYSPEFTSEIGVLARSVETYLLDKPSGLVWLGLGGKKQDSLALELSKTLPFYFLGVGAAFDFSAGAKKRSPKIISRVGLEWLFRWVSEPLRLSERYFFGNAKFLMLLITKELFGRD